MYLLFSLATLAVSFASGSLHSTKSIESKQAVANAIRRLGAENAAEREKAANELKSAMARDPAAIAALARALNDQEIKVVIAASEALAAVGPEAVPHLTQALWADEQLTRAAAVMALSRIGIAARPTAVPLARLLGSDLPIQVRDSIASTLAELDNPDVIPVVIPLLTHKDIKTRALASRVLIDLEAETPRVLAMYRGLLRGDDALGRLIAASDLAVLGPEAEPLAADLTMHLRDDDASLRQAAAKALGTIGPGAKDAAAELVVRATTDAEPKVRLAAAEAAWRVARVPAAPNALRAMLSSDKFPAKARAAELLWWMVRDREAVAALIRAVEAGGNDGLWAAEVLRQIGPEAASATKAIGVWLTDADANRRGLAAATLHRFGESAKPYIKQLREMAKNDEPMNRVMAVLSATALQNDHETAALATDLFRSNSLEVRRALAMQLMELGLPLKSLAATLRGSLSDADGLTRVYAATALWNTDRSAAARDAFLTNLSDHDSETRSWAALQLGAGLGTDAADAVPTLARAVWDSHSGTTAAEALGRIGPTAKAAIPSLVARLRTTGEPHGAYSSAAEAVGLIGAPAGEVGPILVKLLSHPRGHVRVNAAYALWRIGEDKRGEAALVAALDHRHGRTRGYAAEALWFIRRDPRSIPTLVRLLDQYDVAKSNEQYIAARALGRIGPPARDALPELRRLLANGDRDLVATAKVAIRRIEEKPAPK